MNTKKKKTPADFRRIRCHAYSKRSHLGCQSVRRRQWLLFGLGMDWYSWTYTCSSKDHLLDPCRNSGLASRTGCFFPLNHRYIFCVNSTTFIRVIPKLFRIEDFKWKSAFERYSHCHLKKESRDLTFIRYHARSLPVSLTVSTLRSHTGEAENLKELGDEYFYLGDEYSYLGEAKAAIYLTFVFESKT